MTPEQRQRLIEILHSGGDVAPEWSHILFPPEKREYELVYHGKEREEDIIASTLAVPLQPVRTFNKNGVEWHNKLIFGDNLQAMKTLLEMKRRGELCNADGTPGVRLVYIDPPFATKQDFKGSQDQKAYQDKVIGSKFIEFVRKRLILLRELLADDGCVYVHLDTKKSHYIKAILDEILGEENFINEIVWQRSTAHNMKTKGFVRCNDHIFLYSKSGRSVFNDQYVEYSETQLSRYKADENGVLYKAENLTFSGANHSRQFEWRGTKPPVNRSWGASLEQLEQWWAEGKILKKRNGCPRMDGLKIYLKDTQGGSPISTNWTDIDRIGNTSSERLDYPTQKPESLLERIIRTSSNPGDLVLDAFAGSGTTCAVAEKLGRRWLGIDCGKLAIYTIQKRLLNLKADIGNKGALYKAKPFTLYNAGLYDFTRLKELPWADWRRFALTLFGCQDEPQRIGGIQFDGTLKACPVQVFDHRQQGGATITEDTLRSMHEAAGSRIGTRMFIIAPSLAFDFQQDYIQIGDVRYYALRIPYSIIHELHQRDFLALKQPTDEMAVNDTVDAVGFDFIKTPELDYAVGRGNPEGELLEEAFIRINDFYSEAAVREPVQKRGNRETLSMVMLDYDYDAETDVFDLDEVFYAETIEAAGWEVRFPADRLGEKIMAVFVDIYGNEARVVIPAADFAPSKPGKKSASTKTKNKKT
ncbi:MAG: site-specific DNA-methyltransferase [Desulfurivibrionaceae bacterium]|jgi:site-specific DNA-methyltransferase (adenine-specific)/adenine-specific DNA-methyltransferase